MRDLGRNLFCALLVSPPQIDRVVAVSLRHFRLYLPMFLDPVVCCAFCSVRLAERKNHQEKPPLDCMHWFTVAGGGAGCEPEVYGLGTESIRSQALAVFRCPS